MDEIIEERTLPPDDSEPPKLKKLFTNKWFISAIAVIFILSSLFAGFNVYKTFFLKPQTQGYEVGNTTQTQTIIQDKTYTNEKYNFSFNYPETLFKRTDSTDNFIGLLTVAGDNSTQKYTVSVLDNPTNMDLQEFNQKNKPIPDDRIDIKDTMTKMNGYDVLIERFSLSCVGDCNTPQPKLFSYWVKANTYVIAFNVDTLINPLDPTPEANLIKNMINTLKIEDRPVLVSPTVTKLSPEQVKIETNNFPVYPKATFLGKENVSPCTSGSGQTNCSRMKYIWLANDSGANVLSWYAGPPKDGSPWECKMGHGTGDISKSFLLDASCNSGVRYYNNMQVGSTDGKTVTIVLIEE